MPTLREERVELSSNPAAEVDSSDFTIRSRELREPLNQALLMKRRGFELAEITSERSISRSVEEAVNRELDRVLRVDSYKPAA